MKNAIVIAACLIAVTPSLVAAQTAPKTAVQVKKDVEQTQAILKTKIDEAQAKDNPRFVRTLTNVQVELTLTDQIGNNAPEKKTVSMIVSSGNWGKIRNTGARFGPNQIGLNVDARPFVATDGPIQLELTLYYYPPQGTREAPVEATELNQSLTVVLQSGKPLQISQAADPTRDRKVTVEVKATVLK